MLGTVEKLAEMFEITPNVIDNWEAGGSSAGKAAFLKEVKLLILAGHSLQEIREMVTEEAVKQGQGDTVIYLDRNNARKNKPVESAGQLALNFNPAQIQTTNGISYPEIFSLFTAMLKEMRQYTDRAIDAEKRIVLLEDHEARAKNEYFEANTKVKRLQLQLEQRESKLKEFDDQKKKLNLMEVQMQLMEIENSKKSFWQFWK